MHSKQRQGAPAPSPLEIPETNLWQKAFPFVMGVLLALVFVKFGNPVIFGELIETPRSGIELAINAWPTAWGYCLLAIALAFGVSSWKWKLAGPKWIMILPLVWFGWDLLSACQTINGRLTHQTVPNFAACTVCFYLGVFSLGFVPNRWPLWLGLLLGLLFCLWIGVGQHFGGLEQTRRYVESINWDLYPPELKAKLNSPEFQQKISSDRIFGTFVYPNALAGGIILALPITLVGLWKAGGRVPFIIRGVLVGTFAYLGVACLFWSGSKAGWLIVLGMGVLAFLHLVTISRRLKTLTIISLMVIGLGGFYVKNSAYFAKKNNSASARLDYWRAAWQMIKEKPLLGSGPGTFMIGYQRLKRPEAEPTKLAHNDYLQQGSDSGLVGLCSYLALIAGSIAGLYRRIRRSLDWTVFAVWLGVAGLAVQELVEFSLYIPSLAWPFFLSLGWLW